MENNGEIILLSIGTIAMTVIAAVFISYVLYYGNKIRLKKVSDELQAKQFQKEQYDAFIQTQEKEHLCIARNLHDEVIPSHLKNLNFRGVKLMIPFRETETTSA